MRRFLLALFLLLASAASAQQVFQVGAPQISGLSPLPSADIWVGNGSGIATAVAPSGDLTVSNTGAFTIGANKVTLPDIAQIATNTVLGNSTSGTANVLTQAMPSCSGASSALIWTTNTGFGCNSIASTGTVNSGTAGQLAYYPASAAAVSGNANVTVSGGALTLGVATSVQGSLKLSGSTSGTLTLAVPVAAGANTLTLPAGTTDLSATGGTSQVLKQVTVGAAITVARLACADLSDATALCSAASPLAVANGGTGLASGTSGGVPTYTASGTLASSAALTANLPVIGGGAGAVVSVGSRSGNTTEFGTVTGALTSGNCIKSDASGNLVDAATTCGGTSAMALISTQTASASADLRWTGLSATPNTYMLQCNALVPTTGGGVTRIQIGEGGTPTWDTSSYSYGRQQVASANTASTLGTTVGSGIDVTTGAGQGNVATDGFGLTGWLNNLGSSALQKAIFGTASYSDGTNYIETTFGGQYTGGHAVATSVRVINSAGTIASGQCSLYSLSN